MADSEKLTALKKAYVDIMLNTAKEAAARIMVSERKAQRYRRELFAAKDEALRMLLRLKQMLDAKVNEAEMTVFSKQRKIEELEAQLGEAEDIVKDLRAELHQMQDELERATQNQMQPLGVQTPDGSGATHETELEERILCSSLPAANCTITKAHETKDSTLDGICDSTLCHSDNCFHLDNSFDYSPDPASIMMRSKEPELYRNGCTQRIRAFERNQLDGDDLLCGQAGGARNLVCKGEGEEDWKKCKKVSTMNNNMFDGDTRPDEAMVVPADDACFQLHAVRFNRKRKRKSKKRKCKTLLFKEFPYQIDNTLSGKDCQKDQGTLLLSISSSNTSLCGQAGGARNLICKGEVEEDCKKCKKVSTINNNMFDGDTRPDEAKLAPADDACFQLHALRFNRKRKSKKRKCKALLFKEFPYQVDNTLSGKDCQKDQGTLLLSISSSNTNESKSQSRYLEAITCDSDFLRSCTGQDIGNNDKLLSNELALSGKEAVCTEISECPGSKPAIGVDSVLLVNSDPKEADASVALTRQQIDNKFLKYTFQRKRKKEGTSSPDGESSLDSSSFARKVEEKSSDIMVAQKPSLLNESSRDGRRVAQVARQLISSSWKKWHR
ncbi:hypothetical protein K2173_023121 [Erythroxylum novogranatense]|uniref:Uncharacterized protein n=1 Tax=Erythroxylum novogranatense TaxID=1862640 RepID=A0AAV8S7D6_9ROSI|nr:hypothetical protein K2173_023121 [Erythroxylum novogranatense]